MELIAQHRVPVLDSTHHQQWQFSRYSYLEQPRPNHGLLLLLSGEMDYVNRGARLQVQPLDLVYLPQGSRYEARIHSGTDDLLMNFHFVQGDAGELPAEPCRVLTDTLHTLQPLMEQTVRIFQEGPDRYLAAMAQFYLFCQELSGMLRHTADSDRALVLRAKTLLSQPDCPDLEEVAKRLLVSASGLRKKFKEAEGIPPAQYRLAQRVESAKRLLLSTDLPVSRIAEACGFCDAAYFHKVFCRLTGLTPTAYRSSRPSQC